MRQQLFWDGSKQTAVLSASKIMIDGGTGFINVPKFNISCVASEIDAKLLPLLGYGLAKDFTSSAPSLYRK